MPRTMEAPPKLEAQPSSSKALSSEFHDLLHPVTDTSESGSQSREYDLDYLYETNSTQPLLKLPVEILGLILHYFLRPVSLNGVDFQPHWYCSVSDISALIPIAQTCHRLRDVVHSLPAVDKSVIIADRKHQRARHVRKDIPICVLISLYSRISPNMHDFYTNEVHRIQELHLTNLSNKAWDFWSSCLSLPAPKLRFLSLGSPRRICWWPLKGAPVPFPSETRSLQYLTLHGICFLPSCPFPSLTHLALLDVQVPKVHSSLVKMLARCPNLESIVLSRVEDSIKSDLSHRPLIYLPRLRKITIRKMSTEHVDFYMECLPRIPGQCCQLLDVAANATTQSLLARYAPNAYALRLSARDQDEGDEEDLGVYDLDEDSTVSITAIGPDGSFHTTKSNAGHRPNIYPLLKYVSDPAALATVREAWLVSLYPKRGDNDHLIGAFYRREVHLAHLLWEVLAPLPSLETLVHVLHSLEPTLYSLPRAEDPLFAAHKLKAHTIVMADDTLLRNRRQWVSLGRGGNKTARPQPRLRLDRLRNELEAGHFAYLDRLVLQVSPCVVVDGEELLEVAKFVPSVKVERIESLPEFVIPAFCRDAATSSNWVGTLW